MDGETYIHTSNHITNIHGSKFKFLPLHSSPLLIQLFRAQYDFAVKIQKLLKFMANEPARFFSSQQLQNKGKPFKRKGHITILKPQPSNQREDKIPNTWYAQKINKKESNQERTINCLLECFISGRCSSMELAKRGQSSKI